VEGIALARCDFDLALGIPTNQKLGGLFVKVVLGTYYGTGNGLVFDVLATQGMMIQIAGLFELLFSSILKIDFDHILCTYFIEGLYDYFTI